jgi:hypothetical protein
MTIDMMSYEITWGWCRFAMEIKDAAIPAYGARLANASIRPKAALTKVGHCPRCRDRQLRGNSLYRY